MSSLWWQRSSNQGRQPLLSTFLLGLKSHTMLHNEDDDLESKAVMIRMLLQAGDALQCVAWSGGQARTGAAGEHTLAKPAARARASCSGPVGNCRMEGRRYSYSGPTPLQRATGTTTFSRHQPCIQIALISYCKQAKYLLVSSLRQRLPAPAPLRDLAGRPCREQVLQKSGT